MHSKQFDSLAEMLTVEEASAYLGISAQTGYSQARTGALPVIRMGTRKVVPKAALARLIEAVGDAAVEHARAKRTHGDAGASA